MKALGVECVSSGRKNFSQKSLFEWAVDKPKPTKANSPSPQAQQLPYQEEFLLAGRPTMSPQKTVTTTPSKSKIQEYYSIVKPYGVDVESEKMRDVLSSDKSPKVRSLSEIVKTSSTQKSLAEFLNK